MKILSVIRTMNLSHGGPPEVLRNQIDYINSKKTIIHVLKLNSLSFFYLFKILFIKSYRLRFYKFIKKIDLIHFHEIWSLKIIIIIYLANKLLIKHFFVGHGYLDEWSLKQKPLKKILFKFFFLERAIKSSSAFFSSTKKEYIDVKKNFKINNPFIIPNGINIDQFDKRTLEYKKIKKILFFGRIHEKKGLKLLIDSINSLPSNYFDNFSFEITGPGLIDDFKKIQKLISRYSLDKKILVNPPIVRKEKFQYLKKFDIFVLPSYEEGDSIALKEALASYMPVIISKQCRLNIVEEYEAGIEIETNKKSLLNGLMKLQELDLIKMGYNARKLIEEKYDNKICSQRLLNVYEDLFNETRVSEDWVKD